MTLTMGDYSIPIEITLFTTFRTFKMWPTPSYGNCFIFNFFNFPSESTVLPGPGYGLSLVLNLEREFYGGITEAAGIR